MQDILKFIAMVLLFLFIFFLGGCVTKVEYVPVPVEKITLKPNEIQQLNFEAFKVYETNADGVSYTCVNKEEASKIVKMVQETKAYIKQQRDVIEYYENEIIQRNISQ